MKLARETAELAVEPRPAFEGGHELDAVVAREIVLSSSDPLQVRDELLVLEYVAVGLRDHPREPLALGLGQCHLQCVLLHVGDCLTRAWLSPLV